MTISDLSISFLSESVIFAHQNGFAVNCNLAYGIDWSNSSVCNELEQQLLILVDYYIANPDITPCSLLSYRIDYINANNSNVRKWCGAGTHMPTYSVDGEKYACQFFTPLSLGTEKAQLAKSLQFIQDIPIELLDEKCMKCPFVAICPSCCGSNFMDSGSLYKKDDNQCKLTKIVIKANAFFQYSRILHQQLQLTDEEEYRLLNGILIAQELI